MSVCNVPGRWMHYRVCWSPNPQHHHQHPGQPGSWDEGTIGSPVVQCFIGDDEQRWFMWYNGRQEASDVVDVYCPSAGRVGRCMMASTPHPVLICASSTHTHSCTDTHFCHRTLLSPPHPITSLSCSTTTTLPTPGIAVSSNGVDWTRGTGTVAGDRDDDRNMDVGQVLGCSEEWWTFDTRAVGVSDVQVCVCVVYLMYRCVFVFLCVYVFVVNLLAHM